jgi:hypothetical protein
MKNRKVKYFLPGGGYQWEGGREMERVNIHEN